MINTRAIQMYSQVANIEAGITSSLLYHDFINVTLNSYYSTDTLALDINNDSIYDFMFKTYDIKGSSCAADWALLTPYDSTYIIGILEFTDSICNPMNPNQYGKFNYDLVEKFNYGDTIDNYIGYTDSSKYITYGYYPYANPTCMNIYEGYWVGYDGYIGFKKIKNSITYLGWIQIHVIGYSHIEIIDFAYSDNSALIKEFSLENKITLFPNPTNKEVNISGSEIIDQIIITDSMGQIIYNLYPRRKKISLHIDNSGIYLISVVLNDQTTTKKLLVTQ